MKKAIVIIVLIVIAGIVLLATSRVGPPDDFYQRLTYGYRERFPNYALSIEDIQPGKDPRNHYDEAWCLLIKVVSPDAKQVYKIHVVAVREGTSWLGLENYVDLGQLFYQYGCKPKY